MNSKEDVSELRASRFIKTHSCFLDSATCNLMADWFVMTERGFLNIQ